MRTLICLVLLAVCPPRSALVEAAGSTVSWTKSRVDTRDPDFVRQIQTVGRMNGIQMLIPDYRDQHAGEAPPSLDALLREYSLPAEEAVDGWGRPFHYYTTGRTYVLASFGRSGLPRAQRSTPGGVSEVESDWDENIVMVDGEWAQTPFGVCR